MERHPPQRYEAGTGTHKIAQSKIGSAVRVRLSSKNPG